LSRRWRACARCHRPDRVVAGCVLQMEGCTTTLQRKPPHGLGLYARRTGFQSRNPRLGARPPAARTGAQGAPRPAPEPRRPARLGPHPWAQGLAGQRLAQGLWRPGLDGGAKTPVRRRMRPRRGPAGHPLRPGDGGPGDHGLRQRRAAAALPARHRQWRGLVVPGLQRARGRLRSGQPQNPRRVPGRPLPGQRPESLDHAGPARRLDILSWCAPATKASPRAASVFC